jgi:hypothetical protein
LSAAHDAASKQVPVPPVMVTVVPVIEQGPAAVIAAVVLAVVAAETTKVDPMTAAAGAPLKVTVGAVLVALGDWLAVVAE